MGGFVLGVTGDGSSGPSNIQVKEIIIRNVADNKTDELIIYNYLIGKYALNYPSFDNGKLLLTFDDMALSLYTRAFPLLQAKEVRGTFYVITSKVGTSGYATWDNIREMNVAGMDMQCHTNTHPDLRTLNQSQVLVELQAVNDAFATNSLPAPHHIAYPGGYTSANIKSWVSTMRRTGRIAGGVWAMTKNTDKFALPVLWNDDIAETTTVKGYMLASYKSNTTLILLNHGVSDAGGTYEVAADHLNDIIDYAKSIGMDIITIKELYTLL